MRRTATILATVALMVAFSSGVALAAYEHSITGTDHTDILSGTKQAERISGLGGGDQITGGGSDNLIGQGGDASVDRFYGGRGDDIVQPRDIPAVKDKVYCGPGTDTVYADTADVVGDDCER